MKNFICLLVVFSMLFSVASFQTSASDNITLNIVPNNIDSSLNISGIINSTRDNIPITLLISQNGTVVGAEETVAIGKTEYGVPFSFNPIILSATVLTGTLDVEVTASKININKTTTYEYVGVDNQYTAIKRVSDALVLEDTSFLMEEIGATAADLGVIFSDYENLSDDSKSVVKDAIKDLRLDLPDSYNTIELCVKIREEIEKYKDMYREAITIGRFFDVTTVDELKEWYDNYKTSYGFLEDVTNTPEDERVMLSYFDEAISAPSYLNRIANMRSIRKIADLNLAMKHQALLQQVQDSNHNVISRILSDFPLLLTSVNYQSYNSLESKQKRTVHDAIAGRIFNSLDELTNEINAQILAVSTVVYVPSGNSSSPSKKGGGGNYVAPPESYQDERTSQFTDIENISWAKEAITYLYKAGVVSGKSEKTFAPNDNVTRAELAKMLVLGLKLESKATVRDFNDVASGAWYADFVAVAASNGLITGDEYGKFNPDKPITRQDAAVMMYRAIAPEDKAEKAFFEDYDKISEYAKDAVDYMYEKGIINGIGDGMFAPKNNVTRAQIAKMLYLLLV